MTESAIGLNRQDSRGTALTRKACVRSPCVRCGQQVSTSVRSFAESGGTHSRCSFLFSSRFLSHWPMSFDVMLKWRLVSGLRSCHASREAPDPCFRWSMNLFLLAQDPLDLFCLDVCVYSRIIAHLTLFHFYSACLMNEPFAFLFCWRIVPCPTFIAENSRRLMWKPAAEVRALRALFQRTAVVIM